LATILTLSVISLSEDWLSAYRNQAQQVVRLAAVAASTPADKNAEPFLTNEFNNMRALKDKYLQMTKSRTYIDPNSLDNDPLDQKIGTCAHSLASGDGQSVYRRPLPVNSQMPTKHRRRKFMSQVYQFAQS
jgi:hypothetical protein